MIKSSFVYTKEELDTFLSYILRKNVALKIIYVCSAVILACSIFMFCTASYVEGALYLACGVFFAFYGLILKLVGDKNNKKNINNVDTYEFSEDSIFATTANAQGEQIASLTVRYEDIFKLVQNGENRAYIFVNKVVALIVARENFENPSEFDEVINRIKMKMPKKA